MWDPYRKMTAVLVWWEPHLGRNWMEQPWNQGDFCPDMGTCQQCKFSNFSKFWNATVKFCSETPEDVHLALCDLQFLQTAAAAPQLDLYHVMILLWRAHCEEGSPRAWGDLAQLLAKRASAVVVLVRGDYWCEKGICGWGWEGGTEGSIFSPLSSKLSVPVSMLFGCDEHHGCHLLEWLQYLWKERWICCQDFQGQRGPDS